MTARLSGKVALITGASRGIGKSVAEAFAREGAKVFLTGRVDEDALMRTLAEVRRLGDAEGGLFDVSSHSEVTRLADAIGERYGALDILVNNAGNIAPTPLLRITPEQWERTIATHLSGAFYCTVEMVRRFMQSKRRGKIISVTAPSAVRGGSGVADYASAKGGIIAFTRNAARELLPLNIQVNAVLPVARSRMTDALAEYYVRFVNEETAAMLRRLPDPEKVVPPFLFFAGSESDYITGQVLAADGGLTA